MKRLFIFFLIGISISFAALAQNPPTSQLLHVMVIDNDTLPHVDLPTVDIYGLSRFNRKNEDQQFWRMVMRVKKVLPYAKEAAILLKKYEMEVSPDARGRDRRVYVRRAEDELMKKYGPTLRNMSISDGRVLIKLIDRETQKVSYDLIHDLKGGVTAVFWQGVARIFGNNLKSSYDPLGEDRQIEQIIHYIDMGYI
ncbi:MAG TPA: DUF4294 domain-containing protein [Prolixibacteraceae bacterium]